MRDDAKTTRDDAKTTIAVAEDTTGREMISPPEPQMIEPEAPLPPRVMQVALVIAESIARRMREARAGSDEPESRTP